MSAMFSHLAHDAHRRQSSVVCIHTSYSLKSPTLSLTLSLSVLLSLVRVQINDSALVSYILDHLYSSSTQTYSNNEEVYAHIGIMVLKE